MTPGLNPRPETVEKKTEQMYYRMSNKSPLALLMLLGVYGFMKSRETPHEVRNELWVEIPGVTESFVGALEQQRAQPARQHGSSKGVVWVLAITGAAVCIFLFCCIGPLALQAVLKLGTSRLANAKNARSQSPSASDINWNELNQHRGDHFFEDPADKRYVLSLPPRAVARVHYEFRAKAENGLQVFDVEARQLKAMGTLALRNEGDVTLEAPPGRPATFYLVGRHKLGNLSEQRWYVSELRIEEEQPDRIVLGWKDASGPDFDKVRAVITIDKR